MVWGVKTPWIAKLGNNRDQLIGHRHQNTPQNKNLGCIWCTTPSMEWPSCAKNATDKLVMQPWIFAMTNF